MDLKLLILYIFCCFLTPTNYAFNILVYSPVFGASHTNFMARIADTLTEAGHSVTFLAPVVFEASKDQLSVKLTRDVVLVEPEKKEEKQKQKPDEAALIKGADQHWRVDVNSENVGTMFSGFTNAMNVTCHEFFQRKTVFEKMKSRNFDVAIFEPLSVCGLGYFHALGIRKIITTTSTVFYDPVVDAIGEPLDLSYFPGILSRFDFSKSEEMSLSEKVEAYKVTTLYQKGTFEVFDAETRIYQKYLDSKIPSWRQLLLDSSLHFTNSIPYMDFPRTVTQKTIPIGGIQVDLKAINAQKLSDDWEKVLSKRPMNMLISFGSVTRSMDMPVEWRSGLLYAIKSQPNVTFIWKFESDDVTFAENIPNIHFAKWVPQTALLTDRRLTAFITHGGLGSTNELAHLGKPAIMIPVFADQFRNSKMLARHGGVIVYEKVELKNEYKIQSAVKKILYDEKYRKNAENLAEMLRNQPLKPKEQVVRYVEFVARFGPFPKMNIGGRGLGFLQKNLIDIYFVIYFPYVISIFAIVLVIVIGLLVRLGRKTEKLE